MQASVVTDWTTRNISSPNKLRPKNKKAKNKLGPKPYIQFCDFFEVFHSATKNYEVDIHNLDDLVYNILKQKLI